MWIVPILMYLLFDQYERFNLDKVHDQYFFLTDSQLYRIGFILAI